MSENNNHEKCHWVGLDVAKNTFDAALVLPHQHFPSTPLHKIPTRKFKRTPEGVTKLLTWLDQKCPDHDNVRVIMEATGNYSPELALWLIEQRPTLQPAIANPYHTSSYIKSMGVRNKTDKLEARALGFYGVERHPLPYEPPTPERAQLRELSRCRDYLVKESTRLKNKLKENSDSIEVTKMFTKRLRLLKNDITRIETSMRELVETHEELKHDIELLNTITGIAFISAAMIIAELGDLRRFKRSRQLSAFAGMSPKHHQSGTSINGRSRLCKQGNPRVRQGLYLSAMVTIRSNNQFQHLYQNLIAQGKAKMVALGAVMRKLLTVMRAMLIKNQTFNPMGITR